MHALGLGRVEQETKRERALPCHRAPLAVGNLARVLDEGADGEENGLQWRVDG
jgi:hypothetical protein